MIQCGLSHNLDGTRTPTYLVLPRRFFVSVVLVDDKVIGEDVERDSGNVHLEETRCLIRAVPYEAFVAPAYMRVAYTY